MPINFLVTLLELSAGELVETLIGFTNDAEVELIVTAIEGSFRYFNNHVLGSSV